MDGKDTNLSLYRTAIAKVSCAYFKAGQVVSVSHYYRDADGKDWYLIESTEIAGKLPNPVAYPVDHLTQFCM